MSEATETVAVADSIPQDDSTNMGGKSFYETLVSGGLDDDSTANDSGDGTVIDVPVDNPANPDHTPGETTQEGDGQTDAAEADTDGTVDLLAEVSKLDPEERALLAEKFKEFIEASGQKDSLAPDEAVPEAPKAEEIEKVQQLQQQVAELEHIKQIAQLYRPLSDDDDTTDPEFMNEYLTARDAATMNAIPQMMVPVVSQMIVSMLNNALPAAMAEFIEPTVKGKSNDMLPIIANYFKENPKGSFYDAAEFAAKKLQKETKTGGLLAKLQGKAPIPVNGAKPALAQRGVARTNGQPKPTNNQNSALDALLASWRSGTA